MDLLFLLLMFVALYFVVMRPQQKRQREAMQLLASLALDDDVITAGGIYGTVVDLDEDHVDLRVAEPGPVMRFRRDAIVKIVSEDSSVDEDSADEVDESPTDDVTDRVDDPSSGGARP